MNKMLIQEESIKRFIHQYEETTGVLSSDDDCVLTFTSGTSSSCSCSGTVATSGGGGEVKTSRLIRRLIKEKILVSKELEVGQEVQLLFTDYLVHTGEEYSVRLEGTVEEFDSITNQIDFKISYQSLNS